VEPFFMPLVLLRKRDDDSASKQQDGTDRGTGNDGVLALQSFICNFNDLRYTFPAVICLPLRNQGRDKARQGAAMTTPGADYLSFRNHAQI
jgi:hypothetical protein